MTIRIFQHDDLIITQADAAQLKPKPANWDKVKFGHCFSDHMMEVDWNLKGGWKKPAIVPLHDFSLHPGAKVLHYAIELFEGLKAYRGVDNQIRLFRPDANMNRMRQTAARSALPVSVFLESVDSSFGPNRTK